MVGSILVICTGNVCRSPMAACLLQHALPTCTVVSAGLAAPIGAPADPRAALLLAQEGCDLGDHRARAVDESLVAAADLVLVMDDFQRDELERRYPSARGKTRRIGEFIQVDVPDPYGCSQSMFIIVLELIKMGIDSWLIHLSCPEPATSHGDNS